MRLLAAVLAVLAVAGCFGAVPALALGCAGCCAAGAAEGAGLSGSWLVCCPPDATGSGRAAGGRDGLPCLRRKMLSAGICVAASAWVTTRMLRSRTEGGPERAGSRGTLPKAARMSLLVSRNPRDRSTSSLRRPRLAPSPVPWSKPLPQPGFSFLTMRSTSSHRLCAATKSRHGLRPVTHLAVPSQCQTWFAKSTIALPKGGPKCADQSAPPTSRLNDSNGIPRIPGSGKQKLAWSWT